MPEFHQREEISRMIQQPFLLFFLMLRWGATQSMEFRPKPRGKVSPPNDGDDKIWIHAIAGGMGALAVESTVALYRNSQSRK